MTATEPRNIPVEKIDPRSVYLPEDNPNRMLPEDFEALLKSIQHLGFVQPVVVVPGGPDGYEYTIVDGDHRTRAMIKLGADVYHAVVAADFDEADRLIARLGMNKIRGNLDLLDTARDLEMLVELEVETGNFLATGFDDDTVQNMLKSLSDAEDNLAVFDEIPESDPTPQARGGRGASTTLSLKFLSEIDKVRVSEALMAASNGEDDLVVGLLSILGLEPYQE